MGIAVMLVVFLAMVQLVHSEAQYLQYRCANDTEIIDHLLIDTAPFYNKHKLPTTPVNVRIEMWVQEVTSVSEMTQDFEIGR